MADRRRLIKLSKFLAFILRHHPERFDLELDEAGWASLPRVLEILADLPRFHWADRNAILQVVREGTGDGKKRFEVKNNQIRALYGHSVDRRIDYAPVEPPVHLYHGTSPDTLPAIRREGLRPMGRQYVHLSPDRKTATRVGSRHSSEPVVLEVRALQAHASGITFHHPEEGIYLSEPIPPHFLALPETKRPS